MKIHIPNNNHNERKYIFNVLFKEFLGIKFDIVYENIDYYKITLSNDNQFIINDLFFSKFKNNNNEYLNTNNIPKRLYYLTNDLFDIRDLPILYGNNKIEIEKHNVILHADIIASSFFMLSRWEEYVNKIRDKHNRFPAEDSLAYKHNFLDRPIVNEYVELIWKILQHIGYTGKRKGREFEVTLTHDVDVPRLWWNTKDFIKSIFSELIKRRNINETISLLKFRLKNKDPFDTFDSLMNISEKFNLKSHFFFMSGGTSDKDNFYKINHPFILNLLKEIDNRGHYIGFHPSFNAYNDSTQYKKELDLLKKYSPQNISTGREHYLRFDLPETWQLWEDNNMIWDSTMAYHNKAGFRCGVCYEFPVFNILTRKSLNLIEKPLIVMEGNFITYQDISPEQMEKEIEDLIGKIKKFNGEFVFLWHNSAFNRIGVLKFQHLYEKIIFNMFN